MKSRRIKVIGSEYYQSSYKNHEGYPDPTAGIAIERCSGIVLISRTKEAGEGESNKRKTRKRRKRQCIRNDE